MMHNPPIADRVAELGSQLRFRGGLSGADRELAILTAGREVEATYEWAAHEPLGLEAGVSREAVEVLRHQGSTAALQEHEALIIDVVRAIYREHKVPDDLYAKAEAAFGQPTLVELVVLAGYLKLVHSSVVARFRGRMINVHPALLPAFGGSGMYGHRVHEAVLASGATESGATVHFVDEAFDRGAIIAQEKVPVHKGDTAETLAARVLEAEHRLLPKVVLDLARRIS